MMVTTFNAVVDLETDNTIKKTKDPVQAACNAVSLIGSFSLLASMNSVHKSDIIPTIIIQYVLLTKEYVSTMALCARTFFASILLL